MRVLALTIRLMTNVKRFPLRKYNATADEYLRELAAIAEESPDLFDRTLVIHISKDNKVDWHLNGNMMLREAIGILEIYKGDLIECSRNEE